MRRPKVGVSTLREIARSAIKQSAVTTSAISEFLRHSAQKRPNRTPHKRVGMTSNSVDEGGVM